MKWIALCFVLLCCGCAGPSMMGFPHSNMHPMGGNEIAIVPHFGGGASIGSVSSESAGFLTGGAMVSYVHDFGKVGLSLGGGAYMLTDIPNVHCHIEVARNISGSRNDILFGVGYADNLSMGIPQLSLAIMHGAPLTSNGLFSGIRVGSGPIFERVPSGAMVAVSGAMGYQWWSESALGISLQLAPFIAVFTLDENELSAGAVGILAFSFGTRRNEAQ